VNKVSRSIEGAEASIKNISISQNYGKYRGTIGSLYINTEEQKIIMDSAVVIPRYDKYEFARKVGEQTARLNLLIPQVTIEGIKFGEIKDSSLVASKIVIASLELSSFKDKRLPFLRKRNIPLPMAGFLKLPYRIQIDSVVIENSRIMIEEYPENGSDPYEIEIKDVNATITGLSNRPEKERNAHAVMIASGLLLNTGKIKALFIFPLDGSSTYSARGTISKIPFTQLNPILKAVDVRVESGYLNSLTFSFDYTEFNSKGVLEINYEDLRIISLDKNKTTTNEIRTVLINMFVKNSKNQFKSASTQTGIIDIERDRKRYIFNVWVKSILAGVKSSVVGGNPRSREQKK
jgi:sporulation protein YlmC with PRC-barrel domain